MGGREEGRVPHGKGWKSFTFSDDPTSHGYHTDDATVVVIPAIKQQHPQGVVMTTSWAEVKGGAWWHEAQEREGGREGSPRYPVEDGREEAGHACAQFG